MTPDDVLERTQWDLFWLPSEAAAVDRPELAYSFSRVDRSFLNTVVRTRLAADRVDAALEEVRDAHRDVTSRWMITEGTRPLGLDRALERAGYAEAGVHRAATLPVDGWRAVDTGHTVVRVADRAALEALYQVTGSAFGADRRPGDAALDAEVAACADPAGRIHRFVVFDPAGAPVSAGGLTAFPKLRFGLLWAGGTRPEARGRGAYRSLLQARVREARRLGLDAVGLYARADTSWPIVSQLGFEGHGAMVYRDRPLAR